MTPCGTWVPIAVRHGCELSYPVYFSPTLLFTGRGLTPCIISLIWMLDDVGRRDWQVNTDGNK